MATLAQPPQGVTTGPHLDNRRIAAALIDLVIPAAIGAVAYAAGLSFTRGVLLVVIGWTLYYFFALESGEGQTLGKRIMKLRVVSADGSPATMGQIAKRTVVRILDGHIVGLIVMLATGERRQRLGDILAGTVVTEAAVESDASDASTDVMPAAHLSQVPSPDPVEGLSPVRVPWHKRSPKLPSLSKPSFSKPSFGKASFNKPSLRMPTLRKPAKTDAASLPVADAPAPAPMPEALPPSVAPAAAVPEVEPFEPFTESAESEFAEPEFEPEPAFEPRPAEPESIESFMERDVVIEREPTVELDDEGEDEDAEYELPFDAAEPEVAVERPEPAIDYEVEIEEELAPAPDLEIDPEPADESMTIKPIETVSAIDLVMQDAEDRPPGTR